MFKCKLCPQGEIKTVVQGILGAEVLREGTSVLSVEKELSSILNLPAEPTFFRIIVLEKCDYCGNIKILNEQISHR